MPLQCIQQEASSLLHPVQIQVVTPEAALAGDNNNPPIATTARSDITLTLVPSSGSAAPLQSAEADASMNGNPSSHPVGAPPPPRSMTNTCTMEDPMATIMNVLNLMTATVSAYNGFTSVY